MPGPFPGMDPYLESPDSWQGTHNKLITHVEEVLNAILPEPYIADCEIRCYIERPAQAIIPDVHVREREAPEAARRSGGTSVAVSPFLRFEVAPLEIREAFIDIVHAGKQERVVTTIELLSHTNKSLRGRGRQEYLDKQRKALESRAHFIEIDLLRAGRHTIALPPSSLRLARQSDYRICLSRSPQRDIFEVWLTTVREPLPCVAVPLDPDVPDVILDLQAVFDHFYDAGVYRRRLDYTLSPVPPLKPDDAAWADALLRAEDLR